MRCGPNRQPKSAPEQAPDNTQTGHIEIGELDIVRLPRCHPLSFMFIKSIWIGFIGVVLFVASASAASSVLQGIVKDAKGHPIQGADIRIEATNTGRLLTRVKTNVNGRYSLESLAAGNYRVTLVVNGAVKASINNTTLEPGESTHLNFELKQTHASVTVTKGKHRFGYHHLPEVVWPVAGWKLMTVAAGRPQLLLITSYGLVRKNCNGKLTPKPRQPAID